MHYCLAHGRASFSALASRLDYVRDGFAVLVTPGRDDVQTDGFSQLSYRGGAAGGYELGAQGGACADLPGLGAATALASMVLRAAAGRLLAAEADGGGGGAAAADAAPAALALPEVEAGALAHHVGGWAAVRRSLALAAALGRLVWSLAPPNAGELRAVAAAGPAHRLHRLYASLGLIAPAAGAAAAAAHVPGYCRALVCDVAACLAALAAPDRAAVRAACAAAACAPPRPVIAHLCPCCSAARAALLMCDYCGARTGPGVSLRRCAGCRAVAFCGMQCAAAAWAGGHRAACRRAAAGLPPFAAPAGCPEHAP